MASGTSPRVWGKGKELSEAVGIGRNIPTGVGKSRPGACGPRPVAEHPHGCGEKSSRTPTRRTRRGTSPRVWGEAYMVDAKTRGERNIPTGVGRSRSARPPRRARAEHPHGRGEKAGLNCQARIDYGTSPRAWGEGAAQDRRRRRGRNIPTGVGRSQTNIAPSQTGPEHPHGRGEKPKRPARSGSPPGTSPRAWGEAIRIRTGAACIRNIPTGVGRRASRATFDWAGAEHPHGRGEKATAAVLTVAGCGTSPRAWGEGRGRRRVCPRRRNIPTGVGRRATKPSTSRGTAEHPHGRGEKPPRNRGGEREDGTSPRAWGEGP